ncbi:MAG: asparagine synthase (glutamine-hydrolyzing) [Rhodothermales bacterium]
MCGIVGSVLREGGGEDLVREMVALLAHRGPDEQSVYSSAPVTLGFARLSIIDPEAGHQPVYNEDQSVAAICNGEIYNHKHWRRDLEKRGHRFNSDSDAEIVPHLYEEYGESFLEHLHGMFAIALVDQRNKKLILGRDALGIKPLYYLETRRGFYFASEIKCFLLAEEYHPEVDRDALDRLLTFKHIPGQNSLLRWVKAVPPGARLVYDLEQYSASIDSYTDVLSRSTMRPEPSFEEAKAEVCRLFDEAVKMRLMSDVPLGVSLSGGLDSSAVVASVSRQTATPPQTFSVYVGDTVNELGFARMVAERYHTDHHELVLTPEELSTLTPKVMWHMESPISVSEISTYYLGMGVKEFVKVLLCGEGSDELFGGYARFQPINLCSRLPNRVLSWGYVRGLNGFTLRERDRLYSADQKPFLGPNSNAYLDTVLSENGDTVLNRLLRYEMMQELPGSQLERLDKMTMAHSVEARVPFLDTNLVGYVSGLPSRFKVRGFREKVLLKMAMADRLPAPVIERKKYGFANPVKALFRGDFRDICMAEMRANRQILDQFFSYPALERLAGDIGKGFLKVPEQKLLQIYLFLNWYHLFVEKEFRGIADIRHQTSDID